MSQISLQVQPRSGRGKGPARRLRAAGRFPGIVYGGDAQPCAISLDEHIFEQMLNHGLTQNTLINLEVEGESGKQIAILRQLQRDPVSHRPRHVDLLRVRLDQVVEFEIPVHSKGDCEAIKAGGLLEHVQRTVTVRCKPMDVPEAISVDISGLDFHQPIHLGEITLPEGVEVVTDSSAVLFAVIKPRAAVAAGAEAAGEGEAPTEAEASAEAAEATEPEVIGKGKKEEE
ncbi:50S ribosomal protein L25 [Candidatus Sumerlaeota bacterium]|nr:50S ribosomal protein L25 [Candidatus Sumerlaeota bacterium]